MFIKQIRFTSPRNNTLVFVESTEIAPQQSMLGQNNSMKPVQKNIVIHKLKSFDEVNKYCSCERTVIGCRVNFKRAAVVEKLNLKTYKY